jgi:hypothetical protein
MLAYFGYTDATVSVAGPPLIQSRGIGSNECLLGLGLYILQSIQKVLSPIFQMCGDFFCSAKKFNHILQMQSDM